MNKFLIGILLAGGLIFFVYKFWTSDSNERHLRTKALNCLDGKLRILRNTPTYQLVLRDANDFYKTQKSTLKPFAEIKVAVERAFDEYIFFSRDTTKCILMLLEHFPSGTVSGHVRIIHGIRKDKWQFSVGMEMLFPNEDIPSLFPDEYNAGITQYNFSMLSKRARISVLFDGKNSLKNCDLDEKTWFGNQ